MGEGTREQKKFMTNSFNTNILSQILPLKSFFYIKCSFFKSIISLFCTNIFRPGNKGEEGKDWECGCAEVRK